MTELRALVLGAGLQGSAAAYDLARSEGVARVLLVDGDEDSLAEAAPLLAGLAVETRHIELGEGGDLGSLLSGFDACFSALPYFLNPGVAEACARAGLAYVDLGGNTEISRGILELDAVAKESGARLVPDCGLAPGLSATVVAAATRGFSELERVAIRVGGLPADPQPPLGYSLFFSIHGLLNEYTGEATVLREGRIERVATLCEVETIEFPPPVGTCEAFTTLGGVSTLPWSFAGRVRELDYKTVRYPGHAEKIRLLAELGFLAEEPVALADGDVIPRELSARLLGDSLRAGGDRDIVVFRVDVEGWTGGRRARRRYELMDFFDEETGLSAMRRCTAFPASVLLQLLARGEGAGPGAYSVEDAAEPEAVLRELEERGLDLRSELTDLSDDSVNG